MKFNDIEECAFPAQSVISEEISKIDFNDAYRIPLKSNYQSPLDLYIEMVKKTPSWINYLLTIRNKIVQLFGLKDIGKLGEISTIQPHIGAKLDLFYIEYLDDSELVLSLNDKHLNIKLSLLKNTDEGANYLTLSSLVKFNNALGRIYMAIIAPFHKLIVKKMLGNAFG